MDGKGCVKVRTNCYSTPLKPGMRPQAKLLPAYVEIWQERECVCPTCHASVHARPKLFAPLPNSFSPTIGAHL